MIFRILVPVLLSLRLDSLGDETASDNRNAKNIFPVFRILYFVSITSAYNLQQDAAFQNVRSARCKRVQQC